MKHHTLSVIIPCHNNAYFRECLLSLREQTDRDFVTIVVFDKCEDNSEEILWEILGDQYYEVYHTQGGKPSVARNKGIEMCKTDYLTFLDSDDCYSNPNAVKIIKEGVDAMYEKNGKPVDAFRHKVSGDNGVTLRTFCFAWTLRKEFLDASGMRFDERLTYLEDLKWEMQIRFNNKEFRHWPFGFYLADHELVFHRDNERSICHDVQRRLDTEFNDYNLVFSDLAGMNLSEAQKDFFALVYMQTTFRILAERAATRNINFDSLVKRALPLIRQYTFGRLHKSYRVHIDGKPLPLWSLLKLDCDRNILTESQQNSLMIRLLSQTLR